MTTFSDVALPAAMTLLSLAMVNAPPTPWIVPFQGETRVQGGLHYAWQECAVMGGGVLKVENQQCVLCVYVLSWGAFRQKSFSGPPPCLAAQT